MVVFSTFSPWEAGGASRGCAPLSSAPPWPRPLGNLSEPQREGSLPTLERGLFYQQGTWWDGAWCAGWGMGSQVQWHGLGSLLCTMRSVSLGTWGKVLPVLVTASTVTGSGHCRSRCAPRPGFRPGFLCACVSGEVLRTCSERSQNVFPTSRGAGQWCSVRSCGCAAVTTLCPQNLSSPQADTLCPLNTDCLPSPSLAFFGVSSLICSVPVPEKLRFRERRTPLAEARTAGQGVGPWLHPGAACSQTC